MTKKYSILKMKDNFKNLKIKINTIFDMPSRLLIVGKSELSGKSNLIANLILRDNFYRKYYEPDNIIIVCQSSNLDHKWRTMIRELDIPEMNVMSSYNEEALEDLYEIIRDEYIEAIENKEKPKHWLIILDDVSYSGDLKGKQHGIINKLFMNGRHLLISTWITSQKYTDIPTGARENATGLILFSCTNKQLEQIYEDHSNTTKKEFFKMFHDTTDEPYSFLVINYSNPKKDRFLNKDFEPLKLEKK